MFFIIFFVKIHKNNTCFQGFAQKDLYHEDPTGADHLKYTKGLTQALDGYLNGLGFEKEMQNWFDFPVLPTRHTKGLIEGFLAGKVSEKATSNLR